MQKWHVLLKYQQISLFILTLEYQQEHSEADLCQSESDLDPDSPCKI